ncbi:MAG: methionine aminotransferase [Cytophagaceae bacterium]|jgi:methionine aminotransferase|nr:methionine aminotransferase [Cytophagaceae bacterium]
MSISLESRLPRVGTTIFSVMSQLAQEHAAINLAQGFPDFECSPELLELVYKYMRDGYNQYAPMPGVLPLREALATKIASQYQFSPSPENITLTCGATEACFSAITSVVRPGDEVILFEPAFDCYVPAIELAGGIPVYIPMHYPHYQFDWQMVREKVNSKTRLIIINSPHNPTGALLSKHDMLELEHLVIEKKNLIVLSDEVYEHMVFDGLPHESVLKYAALRERSFAIFSLGKTYHVTGWRMGYCVAPAALTKEFRKVHQFNTFSVHTPSQYAMAEFISKKEEYLRLPDFFEKKRDYFLSAMKKSNFEMFPSKGSYFQMASYKNISTQPDVQFARWLVEEAGVAVIPTSVFYHNGVDEHVVRFCIAKKEETLQAAADRLCKI